MTLSEHDYGISEGIAGYYHYHLVKLPHPAVRSLCGAAVMNTEIPLSDWGTITYLKEKYCTKCPIIASEDADDA